MGIGTDAFERMHAAIEEEMGLITEDLLGRSVRDAPVETGRLRGSGRAEVRSEPRRIVGEVSFSTPYAAAQEEHREFKHPRGGKAGYLGDNVKALVPSYRERLARAAREAIDA